jgi:predicted nucleic acid-binding protein
VVKDLDRDWGNYFIVEVSESVAKLGGELTDKHPLRGFDALHLASALFLKSRTHEKILFFCFDERLKSAAEAEGLSVE